MPFSLLLAGFEKSIVDERFTSTVPRSVTAEIPSSSPPTVEHESPEVRKDVTLTHG